MSWLFGSGLGPPIPYPSRLQASDKVRVGNRDNGSAGVIQPDGGKLDQNDVSQYDGEGFGNMDHVSKKVGGLSE